MTPEQEEKVRQALAAAARAERPDGEAVPPQVASRLDEVLAELVAARSPRTAAPAATGSDELAARRARKWREGLVAAAAVAVIAVAGGAVATRGFGGSGDNGSVAGSAADTQQDRVTPQSAGTPSAAQSRSPSARGAVEPQLHSASLAGDVQRVVDAAPAGSTRSGESLTGGGGRTDGAPCELPTGGPGTTLVAVRLDGKPATLVLAPVATDGTREALVYSCSDGSTPVATTRVRQR